MKAYYGDNQFLGVNHSSGKGAAYLAKYSSAVDIAETLKQAWNEGVRDFCFTVNDRTIEAVNLIKAELSRWRLAWTFLPSFVDF